MEAKLPALARADEGDGRLNLKSVKLFADGALGSRGAALLEDYTDSPGWRGILRSKQGIWGPLVKAFYDGVSRDAMMPLAAAPNVVTKYALICYRDGKW
jgi:hypothetical protein